jgi:hypothetical protein
VAAKRLSDGGRGLKPAEVNGPRVSRVRTGSIQASLPDPIFFWVPL